MATTPALRATAATGDAATFTPSPAPPPALAPQLSLTSTAWWQEGIFSLCPAQVGTCAQHGVKPNPTHPGPGQSHHCGFLPAGLPRRTIQMRIKTLQNTTVEEVNSTVCHWKGWAQSRGHTGILGSMAAGGAHASIWPPMGSLGVQQIHKPRGRKHQLHDDGCSPGPVPHPQQINQRPEQLLGLGHNACITLQSFPMLVSFCLSLMPSCCPHCRSQPSWTPWR